MRFGVLPPFQPLFDDRLQCAADQLADQLRRGVIRAGGLALRPRGQFKVRLAGRVNGNDRVIIQQTFIHRPQLLGVQRGVVDAAGDALLLVESQMPEGGEQVPVADEGDVQRLLGEKLPVERRRA